MDCEWRGRNVECRIADCEFLEANRKEKRTAKGAQKRDLLYGGDF